VAVRQRRWTADAAKREDPALSFREFTDMVRALVE